jgi:DNA-3-methyladenine glycosylase
MPKPVSPTFFARSTLVIAPELIGKVIDCHGCSGRIVEVEAYTDDAASHGFQRTKRSAIMHDTFGHVYVYFIYGMYYCLNFTTERDSVGAILIRAVEPLTGIERMRERRSVKELHKLCSGPGKLCQAFDIGAAINGSKIGDELKLWHGEAQEIATSPRIGISKAKELQWRFFEKGNGFVSK